VVFYFMNTSQKVHLLGDKMKAIALVCFSFFLVACNSKDSSSKPAYTYVEKTAGEASNTTSNLSGHGFSQPMPNLTDEELALHLSGDAFFEASFTSAPNTAQPDLDGLGPVFNNADCNSCHQRDGRSSRLTISSNVSEIKLGSGEGLFLRMSISDATRDDQCTSIPAIQNSQNDFCKVIPVPNFGDQLFHRGVRDARDDWNDANNPQKNVGQANVYAKFETKDVTYGDGDTIILSKPIFMIRNPYDAPLESDVTASPSSALLQPNVVTGARNGMPVFGLGLLEAIADEQILALADPSDKNADGISGKVNWVYDVLKANSGDENPISIGRFGWKGNAPTVRQQSLAALRGDIGITNSLFNEESIANTDLHIAYLARTDYDDTGVDAFGNPEASDEFADAVVFYAETLAVPARRNVKDEDVVAGAVLFDQINCTACHNPSFTTRRDGDFKLGGLIPPKGILNQTIYPFTDMLLHDMGDDLADGRRDFLANGKEWKTRPLWGIGLTKTVNPGAGFLHDGRASTLEEAILWHGGEAQASKEQFRLLSKDKREQLVDFLMSL
jgi:CxxC motif-containing protein (DUF1111 family)